MSDEITNDLTQKSNAPKATYLTILTKIASMFSYLRSVFDELIATPLRDISVFSDHIFKKFLGLGPFFTIPFTIIGFLSSLPFLAKLFYKNTVNDLEKVLENIEDDKKIINTPFISSDEKINDENINTKDTDENTNLKEFFDGYLSERGLNHLETEIDKAGKKSKKSLKIKYKKNHPYYIFFFQNWKTNKDFTINGIIEKLCNELNTEEKSLFTQKPTKQLLDNGIPGCNPKELIRALNQIAITATSEKAKNIANTLAQIIPLFIKEDNPEEINTKISIGTLRNNLKKKIKKLPFWKIIGGATLDVSFWYSYTFWDVSFCHSATGGDFNAEDWNKTSLNNIIIITAATSFIELIIRIIVCLLNKRRLLKLLSKPPQCPVTIKDKKLKHALLTKKAINEVGGAALAKLEDVVINTEKIELILKQTPEPITKIDKQFELLKNESDIFRFSFNNLFYVLNGLVTNGIKRGFTGWVIAAVVSASGSLLLLVGMGTPFILMFFGLGLLITINTLNYNLFKSYLNKGQTSHENTLRKKLTRDKDEISTLKRLAKENHKLKNAIKERGEEPLLCYDASNDYSFRRLISRKKTRKESLKTITKKAINRIYLAIAKAGMGILLARLSVFPILILAGAFTGPIGLGIGLSVGFLWMGLCLYHYHRQSKIAEAERALDRLPESIAAATIENKILRKQLTKIIEKTDSQVSVNNDVSPKRRDKKVKKTQETGSQKNGVIPTSEFVDTSNEKGITNIKELSTSEAEKYHPKECSESNNVTTLSPSKVELTPEITHPADTHQSILFGLKKNIPIRDISKPRNPNQFDHPPTFKKTQQYESSSYGTFFTTCNPEKPQNENANKMAGVSNQNSNPTSDAGLLITAGGL